MRCEAGDLAKVLYSIRKENIGKIVLVEKYIGKFKAGDTFDFRGISCMIPIPDHYWWISGEGLSNLFGDTPKAYIPDSWLEPIRPEKDRIKQKEKAPDEVAA